MKSSETFERVISYLVETGYMSEYLDLYTWGEPLLNSELDEILEIFQSYGIKAVVSTNLSLQSEKIAMLVEHKVDLLLVSISGFSDKIYAINHEGGDFGLVLNNLLTLRNYRDKIKKIVLKYLVFRYNRKEIALARDFCIDNNFQFGAYSGAIPCFSSYLRYFEDSSYKNRVDEFVDPKSITSQAVGSCPQESTIVLNHKAELVQCCMSQYQGSGISLFKADISEYLNHRTENEFCLRCLSSGFCHYTHYSRNSQKLLSESHYEWSL